METLNGILGKIEDFCDRGNKRRAQKSKLNFMLIKTTKRP